MQNTIFKALAHPTRREVLVLLKQQPMLAGDLSARFDVSWPTMSRHLATLKDAGLISAERLGNQILYRVNTSVLEDTIAALMSLMGDPDDSDEEQEDAAE